MLALSFALNVCYFGLDNCASMMELPLGNDDSDVAVHKVLRRIDKHTASLLACRLSATVDNFDLFPETRSTDATTRYAVGREVGLYDKHVRADQQRTESPSVRTESPSVFGASTRRSDDSERRVAGGVQVQPIVEVEDLDSQT